MIKSNSWLWLWRVAVACILLTAWEIAGRFGAAAWVSQPTLIATRMVELSTNELPVDVAVTLGEIAGGLLIGLPAGVLIGLVLGRLPFTAALLRPLIISINSVPALALAPLLIMWFGLGLAPKIVLVTLVVFFLVFFNTLSGVQAIDKDWLAALTLMRATRRERFQKVIAPGCLPWILSGFKAALPYSLIAATVGEMMLARSGVGHLITRSATLFDITGIYTALAILMSLGALLNFLAARLEARLLRWRSTQS